MNGDSAQGTHSLLTQVRESQIRIEAQMEEKLKSYDSVKAAAYKAEFVSSQNAKDIEGLEADVAHLRKEGGLLGVILSGAVVVWTYVKDSLP